MMQHCSASFMLEHFLCCSHELLITAQSSTMACGAQLLRLIQATFAGPRLFTLLTGIKKEVDTVMNFMTFSNGVSIWLHAACQETHNFNSWHNCKLANNTRMRCQACLNAFRSFVVQTNLTQTKSGVCSACRLPIASSLSNNQCMKRGCTAWLTWICSRVSGC